jgi:ArsR family transcriptional regulator
MNEFFKVLADETRLRCLAIIFTHSEICVCELIHALALPQSKISRHLAIIKLHKVIHQRRNGQWVYYSIHPRLSSFKKKIIRQTITELSSTPPFDEDAKQLLSIEHRPGLAHTSIQEKSVV